MRRREKENMHVVLWTSAGCHYAIGTDHIQEVVSPGGLDAPYLDPIPVGCQARIKEVPASWTGRSEPVREACFTPAPRIGG